LHRGIYITVVVVRCGVMLGRWISDQEVAGSTPAVPLTCKDPAQVVHTHLPPSSIIWYWPKGNDALQLGR